MGVRHRRLDAHDAVDRAAPADGRAQRRRRVDRHAVRLHVAGNADVLIGRVGQQLRRLVGCPSR